MSTIRIDKNGETVLEFGVTSFPDRKNKCLFVMRGAMLEPLAYFRNDECAERFEKILDMLVVVSNPRGER